MRFSAFISGKCVEWGLLILFPGLRKSQNLNLQLKNKRNCKNQLIILLFYMIQLQNMKQFLISRQHALPWQRYYSFTVVAK